VIREKKSIRLSEIFMAAKEWGAKTILSAVENQQNDLEKS
jgi:hypothetical protein